MKKQGFFKGSAILVGTVTLTKLLGLVYKVPLANILGGTGMGCFSAAFSVFTPIFALAVSGIPTAMARLTSEKAALRRYTDLRRQRRVAEVIFTLTGLAACAVTVTAAYFLSTQKSVALAVCCLAPSVLFCSLMNTQRGYCEGMGNMLPTAVSEIAETVFRLILGLGLALYVRNAAAESYAVTGRVFGRVCENAGAAEQAAVPYIAAAAVLGSSAASGLACAGLALFMRLKGDGITAKMLREDPVADSRKRHIKTLLSLSFQISAAAAVTTLTGMIDMLTIRGCLRYAIEKAPQRFVSVGASAEELPDFLYGSYEGLAVMIYGLVPTLTAMLGKSALPELSEKLAKGSNCGFSHDLRRLLFVSAAASFPCGLGITALSGDILALLFGARPHECAAAAQPLAILGISALFYSTALPCFTVLQVLGKPSRVTKILLCGAAAKLVLNIILVPFFGLNGAAVSELVSCIIVFLSSLAGISKLSGCRISLPRLFARPLYAGGVCAVTARLCCDVTASLGGRISAVIGICAGGAAYMLSMYLLGCSPKFFPAKKISAGA